MIVLHAYLDCLGGLSRYLLSEREQGSLFCADTLLAIGKRINADRTNAQINVKLCACTATNAREGYIIKLRRTVAAV